MLKESLSFYFSFWSTYFDFCLDFFLGIENNTSPLTRLNYSQDLEIFFDYLSKNVFDKPIKNITYKDLETLKMRDLEQYISYLSYYQFNNKTYHNGEKGKARKIASLKSFFKYNFKHENLSVDIAAKLISPKIHTKEIVRLEVDEICKLINEAECPEHMTKTQQSFNKHTRSRDVAMLSLFLGTGIRVSECVGINLLDVDFDNNCFKVTRKGGNQVILYFSDEVKSTLQNWVKDREIIMEGLNETALFVSLQKKRISTRAVENLVKKYSLIASPLKKISPHKLRSTYGTNLYRETGDIYVVAEVLGHKDVNTTKKHYAAMSEDIRRSVANKVKLRED